MVIEWQLLEVQRMQKRNLELKAAQERAGRSAASRAEYLARLAQVCPPVYWSYRILPTI